MNPQNDILQIQTDSLAHTLAHAHGGVSRKKNSGGPLKWIIIYKDRNYVQVSIKHKAAHKKIKLYILKI